MKELRLGMIYSFRMILCFELLFTGSEGLVIMIDE